MFIKTPSEIYYISDGAYEFLTEKGVEGNFIRPGAIRQAGINIFINKLSYVNFADNRPKSIKRKDDIRKASFYTPIWNMRNVRSSRNLTLDEDAIQNYIVKAIELEILMDKRYKDGPYWRSGTAPVAAVLEAVGLQWLIPEDGVWPESQEPKKLPLIRDRYRRNTLV